MKKTLRTILAGALALVAVSCYDDSALNDAVNKLGDRVSAIEATLSAEVGGVADLLSRIETLEGKVAAIKVETKDGVTTLTLSDESSVVLSKNGVLTIVDGGWATVAPDGTVTPVGVKVGHDLDFKVEGGKLNIYGTEYDVDSKEYAAHVKGTVETSEDGKTVTLKVGDYTLELPLVSSAVATLGLSTDSFFLRYGAEKKVQITATNLSKMYVMNEPDGWRATIEGNTLSISSPTKKAVNADAGEAEGLILIHATDEDGRCVVAELSVETGEGLTMTIDKDGKLVIRNAYTALQKNEMMETEEFGFSPFHFGIMQAAEYMQMVEAGYTIESYWEEREEPYGLSFLPYNVLEKGKYVENEYEVDVIETTVNELFYAANYMELPYGAYVIWVASDNGKGMPADGVISLDYAKMVFEVEVVEVLHNDVKIKVNAKGADGYIIGAVSQSNYLERYPPMSFDEYMQSSSMMNQGPWAQFQLYGQFEPLGMMFTNFSDEPISLSSCLVQNRSMNKSFDFDASYDYWVMPVFMHLMKTEDGMYYDFSAFEYEKHFKPYVQTVKTNALVAGEVVAPEVSYTSTYYTVTADVTPAEGSTVYYAYVDSDTAAELESEQQKFEYLLENCYLPLTEQEACEEDLTPGVPQIFLYAVVSADGKYKTFKQTVYTKELPSVENADLTVAFSDQTTAIDKVSVKVTPAENTVVYGEYMTDSLLGTLADDKAVVEYLCDRTSFTSEKTFEKSGLGSGGKTTLVLVVIDAENKYKVIKLEQTAGSIQYDENIKVELVEKSWTTRFCTAKFKVEGGATKVAVCFRSSLTDYNKGVAEVYAASLDQYNQKLLEVDADGFATLDNVYDNYSNYFYFVGIKEVDGSVVISNAESCSKN